MSIIKQADWRFGKTIHHGNPVIVQRVTEGWFASMEHRATKAHIASGPWETQEEAESAVIRALEKLSQGEGGQ